MKHILIVVLLASSSVLSAQQMNQKIEMTLDELGNADLKVSMKMNAANWQQWIQSLGNNPSALKREIEREMPAFFLDDFHLEKDEMERSFELSLKAYGICKVDKRGKWVLETDEKNIELTELSEQKYMYVNSPSEFGGQIQQTTFVTFPNSASDIEIDKDAFGQTVFQFKMADPGFSISSLIRWFGIALMLGGAVWAIVKMVL